MTRFEQLMAEKRAKIELMESILQKATDEKRAITTEEETQYNEAEKSLDTLQISIVREEKLEREKAELKRAINPIEFPAFISKDTKDPKEFNSFGEFLQAAMTNPRDKRLDPYARSGAETRLHSMGTGTDGGFLVPKQFLDTLLSVSPQTAIFRPRARVIPAGTPPDASITIPTLDQTAAQNVYGGMTVAWLNEGGTKTETNMRLREIELTPHEVAGYVTVTDKLLRNAPAMSGLLQGMMRDCVIGAEEAAFYNGNGVGKPLGILQSAARKNRARQTANSVTWQDLRNMLGDVKRGGNLVWIASPTCVPALMAVTDGTNNIWQANARDGAPQGILGYPLLISERSVALGTAGDLILCDLSYYLIKDGSGPFVANDSGMVNFTSNKTIIKIFWNVDGQSWLSAPLPLEGATASTVSPFVVLN